MPDLFISKNKKASTSPPPNGKSLGFFSMFCENPLGIRVQNQDPTETILLLIRHHFIKNITWATLTVFLFLLPLIFLVFLSFDLLPSSLFPPMYMLVSLVFYYLFAFTYGFIHFIDWFYNVGIVTSRRVIDIDYNNVLYKDVATTDLSDVVDADYTQAGFLSSFYDYGSVKLQTQGRIAHFEFDSAPHPARIVDIISRLIGKSP